MKIYPYFNPTNLMTFGDNLRRARKAAGLTQTELARQTGVTERSLYNYEKNSRAPKIDIVEKFARALNVSTETLLGSFDGPEGGALDQKSLDKLLLQVQLVFGSALNERTKERFFEQVAMAYFESKHHGEE